VAGCGNRGPLLIAREANAVLVSLRYLLLIALCGLSLLARSADDLLDPEDAFAFSARMSGPDVVEVSYRVADGYYLYKSRFRFSAQPAALSLGEPQFPPASWHEDEYFGRTEVYRGRFTVRIPLLANSDVKEFRLSVVSQGCADIGVCYLPNTQVADLVRLGTAPAVRSEP
jgi:thiol:disulfide interchange protein DsbD